jgi:ribosomal protein S2
MVRSEVMQKQFCLINLNDVSSGDNIDYPIPSNDKSFLSVYFFLNLVSNIIYDSYRFRNIN